MTMTGEKTYEKTRTPEIVFLGTGNGTFILLETGVVFAPNKLVRIGSAESSNGAMLHPSSYDPGSPAGTAQNYHLSVRR